MAKTGVFNAFPGVNQIIDIIESVKIADRRHAVFFEQLSMEFDDVARLRTQTDDVNASCQSLKIGIGTRFFAECIHHIKRILVAVKKRRLKTRTAARFKMRDSGISCRFNRRHKIFCQNTRTVSRLETVTERRAHKIDLLFHF